MNGMWVARLEDRKRVEIVRCRGQVRGWTEGAVFPGVDRGKEMEFENIFRWKRWNYGLF
jgi:hypothetical protein